MKLKAILKAKPHRVYTKFNGNTFDINFDKVFPIGGKLIFPIKGVDKDKPNKIVNFSQDELFFY
jgi:hypothetical protein